MSRHLQPRRSTSDNLLYIIIGLIAVVVLQGLIRGTIDTEALGILAGVAGLFAAFIGKSSGGGKGGDG